MAIKTVFKKNLQDVWLVKLVKSTTLGIADTYDFPVKLRLNVITEPSYSDIKLFGTEANNMIKIIDNIDIAKMFDLGDRVYYDNIPPSQHDELQNSNQSANYEVIQEIKRTKNIGIIRLSKIK